MAQSGKIILLSGESELGKTTLCLKLVAKLKSRFTSINGVVCPPVYKGSIKNGIELIILKSGEKRLLAKVNKGDNEGLYTRKWQFDKEVIEWGNQELGKATPCDFLIVDELGPLEFERGLGFLNGFTAVNSRDYLAALVVIRPSLLSNAIKRWPEANIITVTNENRATLVEQVFELLTQHVE